MTYLALFKPLENTEVFFNEINVTHYSNTNKACLCLPYLMEIPEWHEDHLYGNTQSLPRAAHAPEMQWSFLDPRRLLWEFQWWLPHLLLIIWKNYRSSLITHRNFWFRIITWNANDTLTLFRIMRKEQVKTKSTFIIFLNAPVKNMGSSGSTDNTEVDQEIGTA